MIFPKFREFRSDSAGTANLQTIINYLTWDLAKNFKELSVGLRSLTLKENFESFIVEITVPASSEISIRNELQVIPSSMIVLRSYGFNDIVDGQTAWTKDFVFVKNISGSDRTAKIAFLR